MRVRAAAPLFPAHGFGVLRWASPGGAMASGDELSHVYPVGYCFTNISN